MVTFKSITCLCILLKKITVAPKQYCAGGYRYWDSVSLSFICVNIDAAPGLASSALIQESARVVVTWSRIKMAKRG